MWKTGHNMSKNTSPTIVVVITLYNSRATIAQTMDSLRAQTFADWRCVVVNDGSTDDGPGYIRSVMAQDDRFEMISQDNRGLPAARNAGIERAMELGTEYVNFLDSDDVLMPRGLEWMEAAARETGASYGGYEFLGPDGRPIGRQSPISAPYVGLDEQLAWNRTMTHAHLFSRACIGETRFDPAIKVAEDYDMWLRMAVKGVRWKAVEKTVAGYRLRPMSISKNFAMMSRYLEVALARAFHQAREGGWGEARPDVGRSAIDVSEQRFVRTVAGHTFAYATMDALLDSSSDKDRAARLYHDGPVTPRLQVAQIVQASSNALLFGACTAPDLDGVRERTWLAPMYHWWQRCAREGWIGPGDVDACLGELSRKIIHPDVIVGRMLELAEPSSGTRSSIGVVGLDRQGRRLVRRAANAGWRVVAFDSWSDDSEIALLEPIAGAQIVRDGADLRKTAERDNAGWPGVWLVGAGSSPERALDRVTSVVPGARVDRVVSWSNVQEKIGRGNLEMIDAALSETSGIVDQGVISERR